MKFKEIRAEKVTWESAERGKEPSREKGWGLFGGSNNW